MSARRTSPRPNGTTPASSALSRISTSTVWRNAAPGNGTWSRAQRFIAWKPSTQSSFHRFWNRLTCWTSRSVGLSDWKPSSIAVAGTSPVSSITSSGSSRPVEEHLAHEAHLAVVARGSQRDQVADRQLRVAGRQQQREHAGEAVADHGQLVGARLRGRRGHRLRDVVVDVGLERVLGVRRRRRHPVEQEDVEALVAQEADHAVAGQQVEDVALATPGCGRSGSAAGCGARRCGSATGGPCRACHTRSRGVWPRGRAWSRPGSEAVAGPQQLALDRFGAISGRAGPRPLSSRSWRSSAATWLTSA